MEIQHSFNQNDFINEGIVKGIIIKKTIKEKTAVAPVHKALLAINLGVFMLIVLRAGPGVG